MYVCNWVYVPKLLFSSSSIFNVLVSPLRLLGEESFVLWLNLHMHLILAYLCIVNFN